MNKGTISPLRIACPGPVAGLDSAKARRVGMRFPRLRLGTVQAGRTYCSRVLLGPLRQAGAGATIRLGHLLIGRWVLSVSRDGRTARQGVVGFLLANLLLGLALLLPAAGLGEVIAALAGRAHNTVLWPIWLASGGWFAVVAVNYAAWFGFPRRPG